MSALKPLSNQEALDELVDIFLGKDYYITDPLSQYQTNAIIVDEIKEKWRSKMYNTIDWNHWWATIGKTLITGICIAFWCCIINALASYFTGIAHPYFGATAFTLGTLIITAGTIEFYR